MLPVAFLTEGDLNKIVYEDDLFKIEKHYNRGAKIPWYTLWKRVHRSLFGFNLISYWSWQSWGDYEPLMDEITLWYDYDKIKDEF